MAASSSTGQAQRRAYALYMKLSWPPHFRAPRRPWCASPEDAECLLEAGDVARFKKFSLMQKSDDYRECPNAECQNMILGDRNRPAMTCDRCGTAFCSIHANAHPT
jgi:hypothetical protein